MSAQHTPGPWVFDRDTLHINAANGYVVGLCTFPSSRGKLFIEEMAGCRANGALLASAPELLAALQTLLNDYVELVNSGDAGFWDPEEEAQVKAARAAIAKATGAAA